jgi:hypothetical protein
LIPEGSSDAQIGLHGGPGVKSLTPEGSRDTQLALNGSPGVKSLTPEGSPDAQIGLNGRPGVKLLTPGLPFKLIWVSGLLLRCQTFDPGAPI